MSAETVRDYYHRILPFFDLELADPFGVPI